MKPAAIYIKALPFPEREMNPALLKSILHTAMPAVV